jgi:hypothetical protein
MSQQIQITGGAKVRDLQDVIIGTSGVLSSVAFNVANGVPKLDVNGKILVSQLPNSVMEYKGVWNAATNTPTLVNGTGNQGDVYLCNVAGTVDFGAGAIAFVVGDQVIYSGSIWQRASGATGTVTSVAVTESGDSLNITGSPITTSGTINIGFNGTNLQYVNGAGNLTTFPILTGYVPYTGATANVDLGTFNLTADVITGATGSFASNGGSDTFAINHSSGAGIALNITKGGSGEGLYINKTSGSGNAATIIGTLNATTLVKSGGTSSQYLMADGSVSTLTNPITGTGTTNTLPKFTAASTIGNSNITDTGSLITLGSSTTISSGIFRVGSSSIIAFQLYASKNITGGTSAGEVLSDGITQSDVTNRSQYFATAASTAAASFTLASLFHFRATQSTFGAGSTVTNQIGFEVDATLIGATNNFGFRGLIPSGTNRWNLYMSGTANNYMAGSLGIGATNLTGRSLSVSKNITGATTSYAIRQDGIIQSDVTTDARGYHNSLSTAASAFTLANYYHYIATQGTIGGGSAVTNQYGFVVDFLTSATNNYAFFSNINAAANRWNIYMAGTAANYMAGKLLIGSTTDSGELLQINGSSKVTGTLNIGNGTASELLINSALSTNSKSIIFKPSSGNATALLELRPTGTNTDIGALIIRDSETAASGSNVLLIGRANFTLPSTGVSYIASVVSGVSNADSFHLGFIVSNIISGRIESMRIWNNGNLSIQKGGTYTSNTSAILNINSTTQGFLPPRMTATQRAAIASPAEGLIVVQTDGTQGLYLYIGAAWHSITML